MSRLTERFRRPLGLALSVVGGVIAACATTAGPGEIPMVIWFEEYNEVLEGTAAQYGPFWSHEIDVRTRVGSARCVGPSRARIVPPSVDPPHRCDGNRGDAFLTCSDGRQLALTWWNEEQCLSGYGKGRDQEGHTFRLIYGGSAERADVVVREALADLSRKPELPAVGDEATGGGVSTGTGFFVSWEGHIVTNHHVIRDAEKILVRLEGDLVPATLVDTDELNDLALLQVEAIRTPLPLRRHHSLVKGTEVFTLGYPLVALQGQEQKATFGHVNALSGLRGDERFTQIDVPIQPGNSGGPLLTITGEVAGVVTSMLHPLATYQLSGALPQNVNYAIKSDLVYSLVAMNLAEGWETRAEAVQAREPSELIPTVEESVVLVAAY